MAKVLKNPQRRGSDSTKEMLSWLLSGDLQFRVERFGVKSQGAGVRV